MVKSGQVYAVGTEDMDALTFGTDVLLRHLTFSEARKMPIKEFNLSKILAGIDLTHEQVCWNSLYFFLLIDHSIFGFTKSSLTYVFFWDAITAILSEVLAQKEL